MWTRRAAALLFTICAVGTTLLAPASALAKTVELHAYSGTYPDGSWEGTDAVGGPGFPIGQLERIDVDKSTGVVYVASSAGRFYKFSANGASEPFSALGGNTVISQAFGALGDLEVDNSGTSSQGRIYAFPEFGPITAYEPSGVEPEGTNFPLPGGSLGDVCGAAVASNGHLWRNQWNTRLVEYDSKGVSLGSVVTSPTGLCDFEMDSAGNFYALTPYHNSGPIYKFSPTGASLGVFANATGEAIAIDRSNNDVYLDDQNQVRHFTSAGELIETFGLPSGGYPGLVSSRGIAVNSNTHTVYVTSNGAPTRVDAFVSTGPVVVPNATTNAAGPLSRTTATMNGVVNADGVPTSDCKFEWGTTTAYLGGTVACAEGNLFSGSNNNAVTASITGLLPATAYHFRLAVSNGNGTTKGQDREFTTVGAVKDITTKPASNLERMTATLNGSFDADGMATNYYFEYGKYGFYETKVPLPAPPGENVGTPVGTYEVSQSIGGLAMGVEYRYRIVAENNTGKSVGNEVSFTTVTAVKDTRTEPATAIGKNSATLNGSFDTDGIATNYYFEYGKNGLYETTGSYETKVPLPAPPGENVGAPVGADEVSQTLTGLTPGTVYHYRIVAENATYGRTDGADRSFTTVPAVKSVTTLPAEDVKAASATLGGSFDPDGIAMSYYFEWGPSAAYGNYAPVGPPGVSVGGTFGVQEVFQPLAGLEAGRTYHFRIVTENVFGKTTGADTEFVPSEAPTVTRDSARQVNTDGAVLQAEVNPNALLTTYRFAYGPEPCSIATCTLAPAGLLTGIVPQVVSYALTGLEPGRSYYFRIVATNSSGTFTGEDRRFKTFSPDPGVDSCPNSQVRQRTGSALLMDCRAYELVSAANAGGYDVESDLTPGREPLVSSPRAVDRVLYSVHFGAIPGVSGSPTNFGRDPYVAIRQADGWATEYAGLPANGMADPGPFGSPLLAADSSLREFAFGGKDICAPCFSDGSTNIPLRLADGAIGKGMAGSLDPPAAPAGTVREPFSADGTHFIFGSKQPFEVAGNSGETSIYDRDLGSGTTQVVSTTPLGTTMSDEAAELGVSSDGARIVVGNEVSTDPAGNAYYRLYMHVGKSANTVALTPGTSGGALYDGMTSDGSQVFFTTKDRLTGEDSDESADLYVAEVASGSAGLRLLSAGAGAPAGNVDTCDPIANADGNNWNAVGAASADGCGVVAIAGAGGVATATGTVYFLSPEKLDGTGAQDAPNLFVVSPGGAPHRVATLEPGNPAVRDAVKDSEVHRYGDFQTTPDGEFAVFNSSRGLTEFQNVGRSEIYRYDLSDDALACASCAPTGAAPLTDTSLPAYGLALSDDGRVFFTSAEPFVLRDTNELEDAYEWSSGAVQLISTGSSADDAGMLTVSGDGKNAYFFTRQTLVPSDANGSTFKLYDARVGGGFPFTQPTLLCAAADECHGAGTEPPSPPDIGTQTGSGVSSRPPPAANRCRRGFVKRHGRCVKRHRKARRQIGRHG